MPSSDPAQRLKDILYNVQRIESYTDNFDEPAFLSDSKTYDAVERCLERISEAAKKLGTEAEVLCPGIPWPQLRSLGNFLRHEYDRVERERIWIVVDRDLQPLKRAVQSALNELNCE